MEKGYLGRGLSNWRATGRMMRSIIKSRRGGALEREREKGNMEKDLLRLRGAGDGELEMPLKEPVQQF